MNEYNEAQASAAGETFATADEPLPVKDFVEATVYPPEDKEEENRGKIRERRRRCDESHSQRRSRRRKARYSVVLANNDRMSFIGDACRLHVVTN